MEGESDKSKAGDLVTDMLDAGIVKPTEKLKASMAKKAGQITDTDRNKITEMLKGLGKYKDMEESLSTKDDHARRSEKPAKSPKKQESNPHQRTADKSRSPRKFEPGGLLDFIDAEMLNTSPSQTTPSAASSKPGKEIVITPSLTLNNKTNLKALSSAFEKLTVGTCSSVTAPTEKEEKETEESRDSEPDNEGGVVKKKRQRKRNRGKKQEKTAEEVSQEPGVSDLHPVVVYDDDFLSSGNEVEKLSKAKGSYTQLLQTMGKGHTSPKSEISAQKLKPDKTKKKDYKGAESIHIETACDPDGKTKRDVIIGYGFVQDSTDGNTKKQKKKRGQENEKIKPKKEGGVSLKPVDNRVHSPKQSDKHGVKKGKGGGNTAQYNRPLDLDEEEEAPLELDYPTTVTVNVRKQEHKYVIGHQRKHLQEIYLITGVMIDVPPYQSDSEAVILTGLKNQLGPAIALMFSKSQQAQLEATQSKSARAREILLPQGKGHHNVQGHQGHQNKFKGQSGMIAGNLKGYKDQISPPTPPLFGRQHSSNSQSSSSECGLDLSEIKGQNINQNANRGQYDYPDVNRGHARRPYGNVGQINLKGPPLYDQHYGKQGRQQGRGQGQGNRVQEQEMGHRGRVVHNQDQTGQGQTAGNKGQGKRQRTKKALFSEYISREDLSTGLKRGTLIEGPIRINPKNFEEAYVPHPDGCSDVVISSFKDRNRALNGDIVAVEMLEEGDWKLNKEELQFIMESQKKDSCEANEGSDSESDSDIVIESVETIEQVTNETSENQSVIAKSDKQPAQNTENQSKKNSKRDSPTKRFVNLREVMETGGDSVKKMFGAEGSASAKKMLIRTGKVVAIIEKKHCRAATGQLKPFQDKYPDKALFCPNDHRLPRIIVPLNECPDKFLERHQDYCHTLFVARITDWRKDSAFADGHLARSLGEAGEIEPETEGMLIENGIDFNEFPQEVLDCLPKQSPWTIPAVELDTRRDFRSSCVFTIDPSTARDLDDALSCEVLGDGRYKVGVHIADVSYFIKENNSLDNVAQIRATSVYLVQKVIPMLPRLLCEELCSLNPDVDRLTFSVEWIITEEGEIEEEWFGRSVIKSCVKLAYDHAQGFIEQPDKDWSPEELPPISTPYTVEDIKTRVLNLHKIAQHLRKSRLDSGSLRLDQIKLQYSLDKETMMPNGCFVYEQKDSNRLVEEFMLLANMAVAHRINAHFPDHAVLRRHPQPQQKMMENLRDQCSALGIHIDINSAGSLQRSIRSYYGEDEFSLARLQVLVSLCSKPMQNAKYFCTGCIDDEALYHHYALNVPLYTHFTSPIRRYPDIMVHRLLGASLGYCDPPTKAPVQIQKVTENCNDKKTAAKRVGDLSGELFFAVFVKTVGPLEETGMVMAVFDKSFDVFIVRLGVSKRVYCDKLPLREKSFKKERKVPSLKLIWKEEDGKPEVQQEISIFSVVDCVLQQGDLPLQWVVTVKRPIVQMLPT